MPRKRMIDPRIWDSEQVQDLTPAQFKLYVYLISNADDYGRFKISEKMIASKAFPMSEDYTADTCGADLEGICDVGLIETYEVDGKLYGHHPNWKTYQYVQKKQDSIIPDPADGIPVRYQYVTSTVAVTPNRIEKNRIEKNRTSTPTSSISAAPAERSKGKKQSEKEPGKEPGKEPRKEPSKEPSKEPEEDTGLYHSIKDSFLAYNESGFTNWGKEGKAIHGIIDKCSRASPDDPDFYAEVMIKCFWDLKASGEKFYRDQPFTPSTLNASGIWDRVAEQIKLKKSQHDDLELYNKIDIYGIRATESRLEVSHVQ